MTGSCGLDLFTVHDASDGRYKKGKERVRSLYILLKNIFYMLYSLVGTASVDFTASAPCKRLCVEYTFFPRKVT